MDAQRLVVLTLQASIFLTVFVFGLRSGHEDVVYPLRHPAKLARALAAMFVVMPLVAVLLCVGLDLTPAVAISLMALSISPMPPLLPNRQTQAGGRASYGIGMMTIAAPLSILFIPAAAALVGRVLHQPIAMDPLALVRLVVVAVLLPLGLGMLVRMASPAAAERVRRPVFLGAIAGLLVSVLAIIATVLPAALSLVGNGTLLALVVFVVVGLGVGHALGGPVPEERAVLALSTACRHPGIAIAVATANYPHETLVPAAVLLYLLVNLVVSTGYIVHQRQARLAARAAV